MPELPEVETIRKNLHNNIVGNTISSVDVLNPNSFIGNIESIIGAKIINTSRKGKVLNLILDNGLFLSVHLKMSGQLFYNIEPVKHTRVVIYFKDTTHVIFNDIRKFGWVKVSDKEQGTTAPDVTRKEFTIEYLSNITSKSSELIKTFLMDQDKIAGLGNIYANDALFIAGILPHRIAKTLNKEEIQKLYTGVKQVIDEGLRYKGSSASKVYRLPDGTKGSYQSRFKVYSREGKPCAVCGTLIIRDIKNGRSNFYCPSCQS